MHVYLIHVVHTNIMGICFAIHAQLKYVNGVFNVLSVQIRSNRIKFVSTFDCQPVDTPKSQVLVIEFLPTKNLHLNYDLLTMLRFMKLVLYHLSQVRCYDANLA